MLKTILQKFTSRKFITAVTLIVTGLIMMFTQLGQDGAGNIAGGVMGMITAIASGLGYMAAEAKVDAAGIKAVPEAKEVK